VWSIDDAMMLRGRSKTHQYYLADFSLEKLIENGGKVTIVKAGLGLGHLNLL
jgi:hypothetical protein